MKDLERTAGPDKQRQGEKPMLGEQSLRQVLCRKDQVGLAGLNESSVQAKLREFHQTVKDFYNPKVFTALKADFLDVDI
jgi:hypothetical protein